MGVGCSVHVNSEVGSVFVTEEDYKVLIDGLNTSVIGWCPDSGHIVNGGMDVYAIFEQYMSVIRHLHLKDITFQDVWAPMGQGITDFPRLIKMLQDADFDGWVMIEEESFGPLAPILKVRDLDDAIALANASDFGLSSGVVTNDMTAAIRVVKELKTGAVNVNQVPGFRMECSPFGGVKDSGLGIKEGVIEAMKFMTTTKTFSLPW